MDVKKLKDKISEAKLTGEAVAAAIGVDQSTYYRKLNTEGENFTIGQAKKLAALLNLPGSEAADIFLV